MFRFTIRDVLWLTALAAVWAMGWVDRQNLTQSLRLELRTEKLGREMSERMMHEINSELGKKVTAQRLELLKLKEQKAASDP